MRKILILLLLSGAIPVFAQGDEPIAPGETVTGELASESAEMRYTFEGYSGDEVSIRLESTQFDPYLMLEAADGNLEVATNDDFNGSLNAQIDVTLPLDDTYTIVVSSAGGTGSYELTFDRSGLQIIEFGQTVESSLMPVTTRQSFRFTAEAGDVITLSAESNDFDTYLDLSALGTDYALYSYGEGGYGTDAFIGPYVISEDGEYVVTVSSTYELVGEGAYRLTLNRADLTPMTYGETVEGTLTDVVFYSFEASQGDRISVEVDSTLDLTLTAHTADSGIMISDDDGTGANPEIHEHVVSRTGTYLLTLRSFLPGQTGDFSLTLTQTPALSLDEGPQSIVLSKKHRIDYLVFTGEADTTVTLVIDILTGKSQSTYLNVYQNEISLAYADTYQYDNFAHVELEIEVPENGPVYVSLTDYSDTILAIQVALEK